LHSFRLTVAGGSARGCKVFRISVCWDRSEVETLGHRDLTSPLVAPRKRKPRWFEETLKEAKDNVGEPKRHFRESKAPERLGSYLAMVTSIRDAEPETFA